MQKHIVNGKEDVCQPIPNGNFAAIGGVNGVGHGNALITDIEKKAMVSHFGNSDGELQEVQSKEPNILGIYNMIGNISEWVEDEWTDYVYYRKYILVNGYGDGFEYNDLITNFPLDGKAFKIPQGSFKGHVFRGGSVYRLFDIHSTIHKTRAPRWTHHPYWTVDHNAMGIRIVYDLPL